MNSQRWRWCRVCFLRHSERVHVHVRVRALRHRIAIAGHAPRDAEAASLYIAINRRHQRRARAHVSLCRENKEQLSAVAEQQVRRVGAGERGRWRGRGVVGAPTMHAAAGQVRMSTCGSKRRTTNDKLRRSNKAITSSNKAVIVFHYGATAPICIIFCSLARRAAPAR